jgi:pyruvate phosphate dikinase-like enzyme
VDLARLPRFDRRFFDGDEPFTTIGSGELGGKAGGLLAMRDVLGARYDAARFPSIEVSIPRLTVITTDVFDQFIAENRPLDAVSADADDRRIALAFQQTALPVELVGDLRALVNAVHTPLAIRSSSLLEDAIDRPFAGVYATKMIPNNAPDADTRFRKLVEAIKFVYASTFFGEARRYRDAAGCNAAGEKMAIIVQEVVGRRHRERYYPDIAGVARSYNFYPSGGARPDEGVVTLALGLGRTIVDEGIGWAYSPARPRTPPPFGALDDLLDQTQATFWAVNMGAPPAYDPANEVEYLVRCSLAEADDDGTLAGVASTYDPERDRLVAGTSARGPRVIDFAPILQVGTWPLNDAVRHLLEVCDASFKARVEIEFAVTLADRRARLGFLQVRPMSVSASLVTVAEDDLRRADALVASRRVLGNGIDETLRDVVYVVPGAFTAMTSRAIAADLRHVNARLADEQRRYVLIGQGRWGSSHPSLGIPVSWGEIGHAGAIVEVSPASAAVELSQGSHFFHNLSSFRVSYFSLGPQDRPPAWDRLAARAPIADTGRVRHVRFARPMTVKVDGRTGRGVILLPADEGDPA